VISIFAIVILSIIGALFKAGHHSMTGGLEDPQDGEAVAGTVFSAVLVYAVSFVYFPTVKKEGAREGKEGMKDGDEDGMKMGVKEVLGA
jgi:ribonuclease kappa